MDSQRRSAAILVLMGAVVLGTSSLSSFGAVLPESYSALTPVLTLVPGLALITAGIGVAFGKIETDSSSTPSAWAAAVFGAIVLVAFAVGFVLI